MNFQPYNHTTIQPYNQMNYKNTFLSLGAYLTSPEVQTKLAGLNLPTIAHVDLWKEQPSHEKTELAYPLPAVFIDFDETRYDDIGIRYEYDATTSITFYLESETWDSTAIGAENQANALKSLESFDALLEILIDYRNPKGARLIAQRSKYNAGRAHNVVSEIACEMTTYNCA